MKRLIFPSSTATDDYISALMDADLPLEDIQETPPYVVIDGPPEAEESALTLAEDFGGYEVWERSVPV